MADNYSSLRKSLEDAHGALLEIAKGKNASDFGDDFATKGPASNPAARNRSVSSSSLETGGELDPEQSKRLLQYVAGSSDMMEAADVQMITNPKAEIDSIYLTNMITRGATESVTLGETAAVLLGDDSYETVEIYAAIDVTHKVLTRNIEKAAFADTVIDMVVKAVAKDYSYMAVNGDTTSSDLALKVWDGYKIQAEKGRVLSAGGAPISYDVFAAANDAFSDDKRRYLGNDLRFFGHSRMWANWDRALTTRVGTMSDSVLGGAHAANTLGIKPLICNEFTTNQEVPVTTATPCSVLTTLRGPFNMVTGANKINLNINAAGATVHTIPVGVYQPAHFVNTLNALLVANSDPAVAHVDQLGKVYFETSNTGTAATIVVTTDAAECNAVLGLTNGSYHGEDAGSNTVNKGTHLWLTDPKNLWFGILNSLRLYWEYKPRGNKWELTIFSEGIPKLRDTDAIVTVDGIRLNSYLG